MTVCFLPSTIGHFRIKDVEEELGKETEDGWQASVSEDKTLASIDLPH